MKISVWLFLSDIIPSRAKILDRILAKYLKQNIFYKNDDPSFVFKKLKKSGIDGVELLVPSNVAYEDLLRGKAILQKNKIPVLSVHQSLTTLFKISLQQIEKLFEVGKLFSAKMLTIHLSAIEKNTLNEDFFLVLCRLEKKFKVKIGIENNPRSLLSLFKKHTWRGEEFSNYIKEKGLRITFDTTHFAQAEGDIVKFLEEHKNRIINIHLSDYKRYFINRFLFPSRGMHLPLGVGELPIKSFVSNVKRSKYNGLITLEINGTIEDICNSIKIVKKIVK